MTHDLQTRLDGIPERLDAPLHPYFDRTMMDNENGDNYSKGMALDDSILLTDLTPEQVAFIADNRGRIMYLVDQINARGGNCRIELEIAGGDIKNCEISNTHKFH